MATPQPPTAAESGLRDPYEVLGVSRTATDDEIKAAYRKLAIRHHPDKGGDPEQFKAVSAANAILSNPESRRVFDAKGFDGLEKDGMDFEVDLSALGFMSSIAFAMASSLGIKFKTHVNPRILEEALSGTAARRSLRFGVPVADAVDKHGAHFYELMVDEAAAAAGIVVRATAAKDRKFKLLRFEPDATRVPERGLSLLMQEDSAVVSGRGSAGFYFLHFDTHRLDDPLPDALQGGMREEAVFVRLASFRAREGKELRPGAHVFAIYNDNVWGKIKYTLEAWQMASAPPTAVEAAAALRTVEASLSAKRAALQTAEIEFRSAKEAFERVIKGAQAEKAALDELLSQREKAYAAIGSANPVAAAAAATAAAAAAHSAAAWAAPVGATAVGAGGGTRPAAVAPVANPSLAALRQASEAVSGLAGGLAGNFVSLFSKRPAAAAAAAGAPVAAAPFAPRPASSPGGSSRDRKVSFSFPDAASDHPAVGADTPTVASGASSPFNKAGASPAGPAADAMPAGDGGSAPEEVAFVFADEGSRGGSAAVAESLPGEPAAAASATLPS